MQIIYNLVLKYRELVVQKCFNIFVTFFFSSFFLEQRRPSIAMLDYLLIIERLFDSIRHFRSMLSSDLQ